MQLESVLYAMQKFEGPRLPARKAVPSSEAEEGELVRDRQVI